MQGIDLTEYAGLFVFGIIAICAALYFFNYIINGSERANMVVVLSLVGVAISMCIVRTVGFRDASPETVLTICICTISLPLIYSISEFYSWVAKQIKTGSEGLKQQFRKIRNWSLVCIGILGVVVLILLNIKHQKIQAETNMAINTASKLAAFGQESFLANDFEEYMVCLREASGLSDLTAELDILYNFETDYNRNERSLKLTIITTFVSEEIDRYFTTEYNKSNGIRLAGIMEAMRRKIATSHTYELDLVGSVSATIKRPEYEFSVMTPTGRMYEYSYGYIDTRTVAIDEDWVFYKECNPYEDIWSSGGVVADIPYDGMPASQISRTTLGPPDEVEKCRDFYKLRPDHQSVSYYWYDDDGKREFYAYALAGEVIRVTDRR